MLSIERTSAHPKRLKVSALPIKPVKATEDSIAFVLIPEYDRLIEFLKLETKLWFGCPRRAGVVYFGHSNLIDDFNGSTAGFVKTLCSEAL